MTTFKDFTRQLLLTFLLPFQNTATQAAVLELECFTPEAKALLRATFRRAAFFGAPLATCRHLVVEAFEREPALAQCVAALDLDVDVVRDAIAATLGDEQESTEMAAVAAVRADRLLWIVAVVAREQQRIGGHAMGPKHLVASAVLYDAELGRELAAFGVSRYALLTFFAHGVVAHAPIDDDAFGGHDVLDVWLDNDDATPMDFVVAVLKDDLALPASDAVRHMRAVHEQGTARVTTLPRAEAIGRANAVLERGRLHGVPLRAHVAPTEAPEGQPGTRRPASRRRGP